MKMMFNHQSDQIQYYATIHIELPLLCRDLWETMENSTDTNQRHPESSDTADAWQYATSMPEDVATAIR